MLTAALVTVMAVALAAYVALPLLAPGRADPLADDRDPLQQELEEERDALFRAIRELDARVDLAEARREELRARYEAKAAGVLRALDERTRELQTGTPRPRPAGRSRVPWGVVGLLAIGAGTAVTLGGWVLPRVGDGTVTTFFQEDLSAAQELRALQEEVEQDPTPDALLELADAYWRAEDASGAQETYRRLLDAEADAPARAYARLGLLTLQDDVTEAEALLEEARARDPADAITLATLGELYLARGAYGEAQAAFEDLLNTPDGAGDTVAAERLELAREVAPLAEAVAEDPDEAALLELGQALWGHGLRNPAADVYLRVLQSHDDSHPTALSRLGQLLFESGRAEEAVTLLERARQSASLRGTELDPRTWLFLGNAAFSDARWQDAIDAWEGYVARVEAPGRVPDLIDDARARRDGEVPADAEVALPDADAAGSPEPPTAGGDAAAGGAPAGDGADLYAQHCASCHGPRGGGGSGPRLAGNPDAGRPNYVRDLILSGRGMMPGFRGTLDVEAIDVLGTYVVEAFGP